MCNKGRTAASEPASTAAQTPRQLPLHWVRSLRFLQPLFDVGTALRHSSAKLERRGSALSGDESGRC